MPEGFFPIVCGENWAAKPWSSRSLLRRSILAANNREKTLWHLGYFRVRGTDQKIQKCRKARTLPWSARDFSSAVSGFCQVKASPLVTSAYGRRCVDLRPTPKIPENSRRTQEKPLVPRVRERLLFAQTKGGKMLHVAYRDWQEYFMCLNLTNQLFPRRKPSLTPLWMTVCWFCSLLFTLVEFVLQRKNSTQKCSRWTKKN